MSGTLHTSAGEDLAAMPGVRFKFVLAGLLLVLALSSLDANIVGPALPTITTDLGSLSSLAWVMTIFLLTSTAATPLYGKLSDMYGRRPLLIVAIVLFLGGSALCGIAQDMFQLIAGRGIQGLGAGGLMTLTQVTMSDLVAVKDRGKYQGLFGAVFTLANLGGAPFGGVITEYWSWRWIFYVNVPIGVLALALLWLGLPPGKRSGEHRIDYLGIAMTTTAAASALMALNLGSHAGWVSPRAMIFAIVAIALALALGPIEAKSPEPLIPTKMMANRIWLTASMSSTLLTIGVTGGLAFLPLYLQMVDGISPATSAVMMVPSAAGLMLSLIFGGQLLSKTGHYKQLSVIGVGLAASSLIVLTIIAGVMPVSALISVMLFPLGAGLGLMMPGLTVAFQNAVDPKDMGVATATAGFFRSLGGAFSVSAAGAVMASHVGALLPNQRGPIEDISNIGLRQMAHISMIERAEVIGHYQAAIFYIFIGASVIAVAGFLMLLAMPERETATGAEEQRAAA